MSRAVVLVALALAGCYDPHPSSGAPCNGDEQCPRSQRCIANACGGTKSGDDGGVLPPADADLTCSCVGSTLSCASGENTCDLGCSIVGAPHCARIVPSNGVDPAWADTLTDSIKLENGTITIDSDTGEITGGFTRAAGSGVKAGIGFQAHISQSRPIGVFVFRDLKIQAGANIVVKGTSAVAFLIRENADIAGVLEGSAGCNNSRSCAGPGGFGGKRAGDAVVGCGGKHGSSAGNSADGGGGGGGNGSSGGTGGLGGSTAGGTGGGMCGSASVEPLVGGGGGGGGGPGGTTVPAGGGGGGGAIQITALGTLTVTATISMNGAGGEGGPLATNSGAGAGGGAGGSILLEAAAITFTGATLAANGGGGGGGGNGTDNIAGSPGQNGTPGMMPAAGGAAAAPAAAGGTGAAGANAPGNGLNGGATTNGGGAGGGIGRIVVRAVAPSGSGLSSSPSPQISTITTN